MPLIFHPVTFKRLSIDFIVSETNSHSFERERVEWSRLGICEMKVEKMCNIWSEESSKPVTVVSCLQRVQDYHIIITNSTLYISYQRRVDYFWIKIFILSIISGVNQAVHVDLMTSELGTVLQRRLRGSTQYSGLNLFVLSSIHCPGTSNSVILNVSSLIDWWT